MIHKPHQNPVQVKVRLLGDWQIHRCKAGDVVTVFWKDFEYLRDNGMAVEMTEHEEVMSAAREAAMKPLAGGISAPGKAKL